MKDMKQVVAQVKLAYDIVDYIQQSGVTLKQRGNKWIGLCVFHNEKTPSFSVDSHFQNYRCFGCGASGDIFSFVEKYEHLEFMEAVRKLAEDKNINVEFDSSSTVDYKSLRACIKSAANFYVSEFRKLPSEHKAVKEITNRKLSTKSTLYGYAPEGRNTLYNHLRKEGYSDETILLTGVCKKSEKSDTIFDFWQGRLMFFVTDISGRPIGFSGKKLFEEDKMGKYVNSSDSVLFDKGNSLYNIHKAKATAAEKKLIFVNEGQFDVSAMIEAGMENSVASLGTAFTLNQGLMARRLVSENGRIVFCFDGDKAGVEAANKVFKNIPTIHSQSYAVPFPDDMDPCDYSLMYGKEALAEYVEQKTIPLVEFVINNMSKDYDMDSTLERSKYIDAVSKVLATITNTPLRESYIRKVSLDSFTPVDAVREIVSKSTTLNADNSDKGEQEVSENEEKKDVELREYEIVSENDADKNEISYEDFVSLIENNSTYEAAAKILNIVLMDVRFAPVVVKHRKYIPAEFDSIMKDLEELSKEQTVLIPELFNRSDVIRYISDTNMFPFSHLMNFETYKEHLKFLLNYLKQNKMSNNTAYVQGNIVKVLQKSRNVDDPIEILSKAIEKEEALRRKLA